MTDMLPRDFADQLRLARRELIDDWHPDHCFEVVRIHWDGDNGPEFEEQDALSWSEVQQLTKLACDHMVAFYDCSALEQTRNRVAQNAVQQAVRNWHYARNYLNRQINVLRDIYSDCEMRARDDVRRMSPQRRAEAFPHGITPQAAARSYASEPQVNKIKTTAAMIQACRASTDYLGAIARAHIAWYDERFEAPDTAERMTARQLDREAAIAAFELVKDIVDRELPPVAVDA